MRSVRAGIVPAFDAEHLRLQAGVSDAWPELAGIPISTEDAKYLYRWEIMTLTAKQQRVCDLVVKGCTAKEIAQQLGIGARTVEGHRAAIYRKLGVRNAIELTRKTLETAE